MVDLTSLTIVTFCYHSDLSRERACTCGICTVLNGIVVARRVLMPKIRKRLGYSRVVPFLSPSLALSITSFPLSIKTFKMILVSFLSPVSVFGTCSRWDIYHSFQLLPPETLKIKTTLRRTNVILMSLGVWGMDSKVCLLAECYNFSNLPSSAYSFLPNLIDVSLNRQRCNRSAPLPMAT